MRRGWFSIEEKSMSDKRQYHWESDDIIHRPEYPAIIPWIHEGAKVFADNGD